MADANDERPRRALRCPGCSTRITVPAGTTGGARARCGACGQLFRIPPAAAEARVPAEAAIRQTATKAKLLNIDDLPEDLRRELRRRRETTQDVRPPQVAPEEPARQLDKEEAVRRAFDLTEDGTPHRRSGVQQVDVAALLKALGESEDED